MEEYINIKLIKKLVREGESRRHSDQGHLPNSARKGEMMLYRVVKH